MFIGSKPALVWRQASKLSVTLVLVCFSIVASDGETAPPRLSFYCGPPQLTNDRCSFSFHPLDENRWFQKKFGNGTHCVSRACLFFDSLTYFNTYCRGIIGIKFNQYRPNPWINPWDGNFKCLFLWFSSCAINPIENEAVLARLMKLSQGAIELVDVLGQLPGFNWAKGHTKVKPLTHWLLFIAFGLSVVFILGGWGYSS